MSNLTYDSAPVAVRQGLANVHKRTWQRLAEPGTWWDGPTRVAIAAELRNAKSCALCKRRKTALSPYALKGTHDSLGELPEPLVDVIHRIVTDPGRLSRDWYQTTLSSGLSDAEYVEAIGIIACVMAVDQFTLGIGMQPHALPNPVGGKPSRQRPQGAKQSAAWVPMLAPKDVSEAEAGLYPEGLPVITYVRRALTLVPAEARAYNEISDEQYTPAGASWDIGRQVRAISYSQVEFIASKVSILNECFY